MRHLSRIASVQILSLKVRPRPIIIRTPHAVTHNTSAVAREVNEMALKSKYPDVKIPENISWPDFVFRNFDKYGENVAIVSIA